MRQSAFMMNRDEIQTELYRIFYEQFEIEAPDPDEDLPGEHGFDSIDAIELLVEIEKMLDITLSQEQKKEAVLKVRTTNQNVDYIEHLLQMARTTPANA